MASHQGWLSAVIFARTRDRDAVDEILQETALAAVSGTPPTDVEEMSRWLYRVAIRQSILYRRRQTRNVKKNQAFANKASTAHTKEYSHSPYAILAAHEQAEQVAKAVQNLSNSDHEILLLKYSESWSCQQIAVRLGISLSAVKSRLLRARKHLRQELLRISDTWDLE